MEKVSSSVQDGRLARVRGCKASRGSRVNVIRGRGTSSWKQVHVMRQLWIGLIVVMVVVSFLAMAQMTYDSLVEKGSWQENEISKSTNLKINLNEERELFLDDYNEQNEGSSSWYSNIMKPLGNIFGFNRDQRSSESGDDSSSRDQNLHIVKQGYLNYKRFPEPLSTQERRQVNESSTKTIDGSDLGAHDHPRVDGQKSLSASSRARGLHMVPADNGPPVIEIDKIKGLDLPLSVSRYSKGRMWHHKEEKAAGKSLESAESRAAQSRLATKQYEYSKDLRCLNNKYDRLIAQKLGMKEISKPLVSADGRFDNPFPTWRPASLLDFVESMILETDQSGVPKDKEELEKSLPMVKPKLEVEVGQEQNFRATWIGHSSLLIQIDGFNILTDPMFSERASPVQFFGPKRIREPAINISSLPQIDIVLISHNHFDHLDTDSVIAINARFDSRTRWIVPLGIGEFLSSNGVKNYVELDWWQKDCFHVGTNSTGNTGSPPAPLASRTPVRIQSADISSMNSPGTPPDRQTSGQNTESTVGSRATKTNRLELAIYLTPAQHWSRRGINDVNKSLWGSFTIISPNGSTFFFGGDSGYCSAFREIAKIFGPFTGAAIPIGAYSPRWFLKSQHVDPEEAVQIHRDIRSAKSIAIHHSTFILSKEHYKEPVNMLAKLMGNRTAEDRQIAGPFLALKHGESVDFPRAAKA